MKKPEIIFSITELGAEIKCGEKIRRYNADLSNLHHNNPCNIPQRGEIQMRNDSLNRRILSGLVYIAQAVYERKCPITLKCDPSVVKEYHRVKRVNCVSSDDWFIKDPQLWRRIIELFDAYGIVPTEEKISSDTIDIDEICNIFE